MATKSKAKAKAPVKAAAKKVAAKAAPKAVSKPVSKPAAKPVAHAHAHPHPHGPMAAHSHGKDGACCSTGGCSFCDCRIWGVLIGLIVGAAAVWAFFSYVKMP